MTHLVNYKSKKWTQTPLRQHGKHILFIVWMSITYLLYLVHSSSFTLEKEMATHSSVLAWRIPGTGEPGGLPSMGSTESDTTEVT